MAIAIRLLYPETKKAPHEDSILRVATLPSINDSLQEYPHS